MFVLMRSPVAGSLPGTGALFQHAVETDGDDDDGDAGFHAE
jgi:hypothetical protein